MFGKEASGTIFFSLWYDSTWDQTQVSRAIGKHCNRKANVHSFLHIEKDILQVNKKTWNNSASYI